MPMPMPMPEHPAPVLVTGFEAFGGETLNPSWRVAEAVHGARIAGVPVLALQLPCVFGSALRVLQAALAQHRPQLVLALGQAAGRSDFSVERIAINVDDARIADNAGAQPVDLPVVAGGPAAYFSTLPIKAIVAALREAGCPASVSQSAGTFVCNHVFYGLMHSLQAWPGTRGGFVHLPLLPAQAAHQGLAVTPPSLALETMLAGLRVAIATALATQADLKLAGGTVA
ncbi:MAG: pyroglutamyl-peptidase I [Rubrivivax sp.]